MEQPVGHSLEKPLSAFIRHLLTKVSVISGAIRCPNKKPCRAGEDDTPPVGLLYQYIAAAEGQIGDLSISNSAGLPHVSNSKQPSKHWCLSL